MTSSNTTFVASIEGGHMWEEMHHYDDDGRHWCPTGYEMCACGKADCPEVREMLHPTCTRWGR